jgi:hypothetical protein
MVTEDRGTFKSFAKNSMQASLALPSTGGGKRNFECVTNPARDRILLRAGMNFHRKRYS